MCGPLVTTSAAATSYCYDDHCPIYRLFTGPSMHLRLQYPAQVAAAAPVQLPLPAAAAGALKPHTHTPPQTPLHTPTHTHPGTLAHTLCCAHPSLASISSPLPLPGPHVRRGSGQRNAR